MITKARVINMTLALVAVAIAARVEPVREVVFAEKKLLGIF